MATKQLCIACVYLLTYILQAGVCIDEWCYLLGGLLVNEDI